MPKKSPARRAFRPTLSCNSLEERCLMSTVPAQVGAVAARGRVAGRLNAGVVGRLNAEIERQMAESNLPSVAVAIVVPGSGRYVAVRGEADLATGRERGLGAPFRIASITKTFTATAVLQLVDRGRLSLTDTLAKWYPDFPNASNITVDDLLRMRSGLPDSLDLDLLKAYYADPLARITPQLSIARAAERAGEIRPAGRETVYNNLNYLFLQEIVGKVTGRDLGAQIQRSILRPLGLDHSLYPSGSRLRGPMRGYGFEPARGGLVDKTVLNPKVAGGAGAMISTLRDLTVYARALATGSLLKPATQRARLDGATLAGSPSFVKYGQGIESLGQFVGHNGTIFGFSSEMFYLPALKATIVINVSRLDADDVSRSTPLFLGLTKIAFPDYVNW